MRTIAALCLSALGTGCTPDARLFSGLLRAAAAPAEELVQQRPTSERVFAVGATLLQVAAQVWIRYHQPEGAAGYLPLDGERFSRLAGSIFESALKRRN